MGKLNLLCPKCGKNKVHYYDANGAYICDNPDCDFLQEVWD